MADTVNEDALKISLAKADTKVTITEDVLKVKLDDGTTKATISPDDVNLKCQEDTLKIVVKDVFGSSIRDLCVYEYAMADYLSMDSIHTESKCIILDDDELIIIWP